MTHDRPERLPCEWREDGKSVLSLHSMTCMLYICGESPRGALLPTNLKATCKFRVATLGREEAIAESWPDGQKHGTKAYQADKLAIDSKVPKGNRNLDA